MDCVRKCWAQERILYWKCICDCGKEKKVRDLSLRRDESKSCGCFQLEISVTHGVSKSSTYKSWEMMRQRCLNKNYDRYSDYGGRGIKICDRWLDFNNFLNDMGEKPAGLSLDRIDVNGNYEPSNCKWSTMKEQNRNRRYNNLISFNGETRCLQEWCELFSIKEGTLRSRLKNGWSVVDALITPARKLTRRINDGY